MKEIERLPPGEHSVGGAGGLAVVIPDSGAGSKLRNCSWKLRYRVRGPGGGWVKRVVMLAASTLSDARAQAEALKAQIREGRDPLAELRAPAPQAPKTLAQVVADYFEAPPKPLADTTRQAYKTATDRLLEHVREATPQALGDYSRRVLPKLLENPTTRNKERRALRGILRWASAEERIEISSERIGKVLQLEDAAHERKDFLLPAQCRAVLEAALAHDATTFDLTRDGSTTTPRYKPIAPFVAFLLLTGCRAGEALSLTWDRVDLDCTDARGQVLGAVELTASDTKTKRRRAVLLDVSPALREMLVRMRPEGAMGSVFDLSKEEARNARERLYKTFGAPKFEYHGLRRTCETYLLHSSVYGSQARAMDLAARQLGHSIQVADRHYIGDLRGVAEARTLEEAMGISELVGQIPV